MLTAICNTISYIKNKHQMNFFQLKHVLGGGEYHNSEIKQQLQLVTKLVEEVRPNGLSDVLLTSKGENKAFPSSSPSCNIVPLFELPIENNKYPNFNRREGRRGVDSLVL